MSRRLRIWLAAAGVALALAGTRCDRDVYLGADPASDAAAPDSGDSGSGAGADGA